MRTALQTTSCVVEPLGQFETLKEVTVTTITIPERVDVLLGCQRAMLAEISNSIVIAGLSLMDAAKAASGVEPEGALTKVMQFQVLLALCVVIVSQIFLSLWEVFTPVRDFKRGKKNLSLNRAWTLPYGLWALGGREYAAEQGAALGSADWDPDSWNSSYVFCVYYLLATHIFFCWDGYALDSLRRCWSQRSPDERESTA
jgi:hypothetical protein